MNASDFSLLLDFFGCSRDQLASRSGTFDVAELLHHGLVEEREDAAAWAATQVPVPNQVAYYQLTERGTVLVEHIVATPMPVEATRWVMP